MNPQGEPTCATASEVFDKFPQVVLQLSVDNKIMARKYISMHRTIIQEALNMSAAKNGGVALFLFLDRIHPEPPPAFVGAMGDCFRYRVPVLPQKQSHFVLVIRPANPARPPLKYLLSFKNLYVMGFLYRNRWRLFSDHDPLAGVSAANQARWITRLPFKGSYVRGGLLPDFFRIKISKQALFDIYNGISNFDNITEARAKELLATTSAMISECVRFPVLKNRVIAILHTGASEMVNFIDSNRVPPQKVAFSLHFNQWRTYCRKAHGGEEAFDPITDDQTLCHPLLRFLGAVLYMT